MTEPRLEVRGPHGAPLGWTQAWVLDRIGDQRLLAVPRLHLAQDPALDLAAGQPYQQVFQDAHVTLDGQDYALLVLHATFDLWKYGEPDLTQVAFALVHGAFDVSRLASYIQRSAEMLR